jgi:hypothetical protein
LAFWESKRENNKVIKENEYPILRGFQIYPNYKREHEALKGQTPAEKCGIKADGKNR